MTQTPSVIPMLSYEDGITAMDWLCKAFGFTAGERFIDNGRLSHGELISEGGGMIILATPTPDYESPKHHRQHCDQAARWSKVPWVINGTLVYVKDIDAHRRQAAAHGAHMLGDMEDGFPGRRYRCEDIEGQRWMFMQADDGATS